MNKAYKFRIYPNAEQMILLAKTFGSSRFIYNRMLEDKIKHYEATKQNLRTTPAQYKDTYEWLREVDSLALANAQLHLQTAYENFFRSPKIGFPKFKAKHRNRDSYTTNCVNGNIQLSKGLLTLPKLKAIRIKQHRDLPSYSKLKSVTVSKTPSGKYFVSILVEVDKKVKQTKLNTFLGLDFSMKELYVASDGSSACYPRYYRSMCAKLAKEQRRLSLCEKGSNNRRKQRIRVARLHEKVANQRKDFLHKCSRQITNAYDAICIEDLNMKGMSQALNFGKSVADNGWGMFTGYLAYKLEEQGKRLIKIDKWYPSSKTCSCCGSIKETLELSERTYICEGCGMVLDRDINASINIKNEGKRLAI